MPKYDTYPEGLRTCIVSEAIERSVAMLSPSLLPEGIRRVSNKIEDANLSSHEIFATTFFSGI